jgi:MtN3 and saliva related transmembrane protein
MCSPVSVVVLVGSAASLLSLYATVPQVVRAARTRSVEGVSWSSILLSMATFTLWCVYAVAVADAIQLVSNTLALVLLAALAVVVMRAGVPRRAWAPVAVVFVSALASFWLVDVASSFTLAMVGTTASSLRMLPQARLAVSRAPLWGLCPWSTLLAWWGTALWLVYGVLAADLPLTICCFVLLAMQSVVLAYRLPLRRTLASLARGRLGRPVAQLVMPISVRLPERRDGYKLAA